MRPAALEAARPQPDVVGKQEPDAAFAFAGQHQQGLAIRAFHDAGAGVGLGVDQAEPAAPFGRRAVGPFEAARHRMPLAGVGQRRAERCVGGDAAGLGGQDLIERGAPQAGRAGVVRAGRHQHGAAAAHVTRDVVEIDDRQHALARVAVEDDEMKLVDLLLEQLAGRECDQRQLVDRRAVLLFRRTQDGEMHEVDAGVGFQQVAP